MISNDRPTHYVTERPENFGRYGFPERSRSALARQSVNHLFVYESISKHHGMHL